MTFDADRGRIVAPNLDDRNWQDLVDEMRALIPQYAKGWTDHNPSDLGITLIELFAWLAEGILFRLNQVPDKNYIAFLNLLGITRDPPTPAHTYLTFTGGPAPVVVPAGTEASTSPVEGQKPVVFETDEDVRVLPVALDTALLIGPYANGATQATYADASAALVGPPAAKTLVTLPAGKSVQLCLGFTDLPAEPVRLGVRLYLPLPSGVTVTWLYSAKDKEPLAWPSPTAAQLGDDTASLSRDGAVLLTPPADLVSQRAAPQASPPDPAWTTVTPADQPARNDLRYWFGIRLTNSGTTQSAVGIDRLLFNAARASTAVTLRTPEIIGTGTGRPFQVVQLSHRPLYRRPDLRAPYGDLVVEVGSGAPTTWETWTLTDDLPAGEGNVYRIDPVVGEVTFGNYDPQNRTGNGSIPPAGSTIRAKYRYVDSGAAGNVAANQVVALMSAPTSGGLKGITGVTNPAPATDGSDEETVEQTLHRAPDELKIRDRAVTAEDYEFLAKEASNEVVVTRCLTPRLLVADGPAGVAGNPWAFGQMTRAPGNVHLVIVPDQGPSVPRPEPTSELVADVQAYLDQRRDLGAHLRVVGPRYLPIIVQAEVVVWQDSFQSLVKAATLDRIAAFLHPTRGGSAGKGWAVGQPVFTSELFRGIMPEPDIGYISTLQVKPDIPLYHYPPFNLQGNDGNFDAGKERPFPLTALSASVRVADYELVSAAAPAKHVVTTISQTL